MANRENENDESQVSSPVSKDMIELAVQLLLNVINLKPNDPKPQRLDSNEFICLVVRPKMRCASPRTIPGNIPVPHSLFPFDGSQKICLIMGNEKKGMNAEVAENKIKEEGLPISKVFQRKQLKAECKTSEDWTKLNLSYDLFMVSKAVLPTIPKLSGLAYPTKKRNLVPVDLSPKQWRGELESACSSAIIFFNHSSCVAKVARVSQTRKEIVENVVAAIDTLVSMLPEKWNNISYICLKTLASPACSLYRSFSKMPIERVETKSQIDEPEMNGEEVITGGRSSKKRNRHAEKTPDAKRKKGLSLEGKTGSLNGQDVADEVPKNDSPATSGLENNTEAVDLQGGVVANSLDASTKKKNSRRSKKTPVRAG